MTKNTLRRLQRLEIRQPCCLTCQPWHQPAPIRTMTPAEADAEPGLRRPAICPDCGRSVPAQILAIIVDDPREDMA